MPRPSTAVVREIRVIRASFRQLARSFAQIAPILANGAGALSRPDKTSKRPRRRPRLSRHQRVVLKLQGRYMGTMRGLKPRQRAKVKKIRAEKGIREAIRTAVRMAG